MCLVVVSTHGPSWAESRSAIPFAKILVDSMSLRLTASRADLLTLFSSRSIALPMLNHVTTAPYLLFPC